MSRYRPAPAREAETEPGSRGRVLRNRRGITRKRDMDRAEYDALLTAQESYLHRITETTRFTADLLRAMHRDWLGGIYDWAGEYRTVEMSKNGFTWPPAYLVPQNMAQFAADALARNTPCTPAPLAEVAGRIAEVHAELLLIHPFREGNGRLARWLAGAMALQAGYVNPVYRFKGRGSSAERARYLDAVLRGYYQDYAALTDYFVEVFERALREER